MSFNKICRSSKDLCVFAAFFCNQCLLRRTIRDKNIHLSNNASLEMYCLISSFKATRIRQSTENVGKRKNRPTIVQIIFHLLWDHWTYYGIQSTLVISNSLISNNRLSRSENLVPVLTQRYSNRQQNIVEKRRNCSLGAISPLFHIIFIISLT